MTAAVTVSVTAAVTAAVADVAVNVATAAVVITAIARYMIAREVNDHKNSVVNYT